MKEAKAYIGFVDPQIESEIDEFVNKERQLAMLHVRDDVTQDLWEQAKHVHIMIRHHSGNAEPPHIAHLEFKGHAPKIATYRFHNYPDDIQQAIVSHHKNMILQKKYISNGTVIIGFGRNR